MHSFWNKLPKPFFVLAPLEDVTDTAFRRLIARHGKPHVMFTEFTSADGLVLANETGKKKLLKKLLYSESERPIVAQLFSAVPERMEAAAYLVAELGFDGVDINMGCPDRAVERGGCGAALIKNPMLARKLIRATKMSRLPVSIKTRIGYDQDELDTWLGELLAEEPAAVTIHARTRKEMSNVPARWESIGRAVKIRDAFGAQTLIIGNGNVLNIDDARVKAAKSGCDGVMLGRAIFGNPWLFTQYRDFVSPDILTARQKIQALIEHLELFDTLLSDTVRFPVMKKHFSSYISGWRGAKELRAKLMNTKNAHEARALLHGM